MRLACNSLYYRTAAGFFVCMLSLEILLLLIVWLLIGKPMVQNSTLDFAKLVQHAAGIYQLLREPERSAFQAQMLQSYALNLDNAAGTPVGSPSHLPYLGYLEDALTQLAGRHVSLVHRGKTYIIDYPSNGKLLRFSFTHDRIGTAPGLALAAMGLQTLLASLLAAVLMARHTTRPIELIAHRTGAAGGGLSEPLPEEGPPELRDIARNFNHMTSQNRALLDSRAAMLAGISHDLRAPITRARMALELARANMDESLALRIERALLQMDSLIAQYLDFSADGAKEGASPLNIPALLKEVAQAHKRANIRFDVPEGIVYLPSRAFIRCAQNLLDNAVKHGAGTLVEVGFYKTAATWVLEIADRGPGIPDGQLDQVFHPFRRLDNARTQPGSGLGLSIIQEICRVQGWFVSLLPRPGGGLIARLSLPIAAQD